MELPELVDRAAYEGLQNDDFIRKLCDERGIDFKYRDWQPGAPADEILEELKALKTFERASFLAPPVLQARRVAHPTLRDASTTRLDSTCDLT